MSMPRIVAYAVLLTVLAFAFGVALNIVSRLL